MATSSARPGQVLTRRETPVLQVQDLTMRYFTQQGQVKAVDGVSFELARGESLGLVGESGCGKTSLALCLLKVLPDNARIVGGKVLLDGIDLVPMPEDEMRRHRWSSISMIFQAAMSSLNPVQRVGQQLVEAIQVHEGIPERQARERVFRLFDMVGLAASLIDRYPHELSGGMKQRVVIALALACQPEVVIADEPTTALDVIVQHRILQQLKGVQEREGTAMVYISHDLGVIAEVSNRIAVMYAGKIVEIADTADLFQRARHPYTGLLMSAFPNLKGPKRDLVSLEGDPPDLVTPPSGCRFHPRCPFATEKCREAEPSLEDYGRGHRAACWHPLNASGNSDG